MICLPRASKYFRLIAVLSFVFFSHTAFASVIAQQIINTDRQGALLEYGQKLGTGISGSLQSVSFFGKTTTADTFFSIVYEYSDPSYSTLVTSHVLFGSSTVTDNVITLATTTPITIDPSKYYLLVMGGVNYNANLMGAATTTSTGYDFGECWNGSSLVPCTDVGTLYFILDSSTTPSIDTSTRFVSVVPTASSTVATSTPTDTGATIYVNSVDYQSGMYLEFYFANQTVNYVGVNAIDAFNSAFGNGNNIRISITSPDTVIYLATSTSFLYPGQTTAYYRIFKPSFFSSLWLVGSYFAGNLVIATSSTFVVGQKTGIDLAIDQKALGDWLLTGTTTVPILQDCYPSTFVLTACLISTIIPPDAVLASDFVQLKDGFLERAPLGYVTRFVSILSNNASTTPLPTFTATFPTGAGSEQIATGTITFDMDDMIQGGGTLLNSIKDPVSGQNVQQIVEPWIQLLIALLTLWYIINDVTAFKNNHLS